MTTSKILSPFSINICLQSTFDESTSCQERKEEFEQLKKQIIQKDCETISLKQLALIHGDSFIKETNLEGGDAKQTLERWEKGDFFIDPGLNRKEISQIREECNEALRILFWIKPGNAKNLQKIVLSLLEEKSYLPLPIFLNGKGVKGHSLTLILIKQDEKVIAHLLDRGQGSSFHEVEGSKKSYSSDYFVISYEKLASDIEKYFFRRSLNTPPMIAAKYLITRRKCMHFVFSFPKK